MYKKVFLLAILVLGASAASNGAMDKKKLFAEAKAQLKNQQHTKRANAECTAIKCGEEGDKCGVDEPVLCSGSTFCSDNDVCTKPVAGDACTSTCYDDDLYCSDEDICKKYDKVGDACTTFCVGNGDIPLTCDPTTLKCKENKAKVGEPCDSETVCEGDSICIPTSYAGNICYLYPSTVDAACNVTSGCDLTKYLYCDSETLKCVEFPKENEACVGICNAGLYCGSDSTCKVQKAANEECTMDIECKDGLTCAEDGKCHKKKPAQNDYCDAEIKCGYEHKCVSNVCVKKDDTCSSGKSEECAGYFMICDNGKCKGDMGIGEGEKCKLEGTSDSEYAISSLQCKEGLSCVPNAESTSEGKCKKVSDAWKECKDDSDCSEGSTCGCNDKDGKLQCIPIPQSNKDFFNKAKKIYDNVAECMDKESQVEQLICAMPEIAKLYVEALKPLDYSAVYRCADFSALGAASAVKVSVVAMAAALLFALFF